MWTKFKNWFRHVFFYVEWQHVGLFEHTMRFSHEPWQLYIHCFESKYGDRRIEIIGAKELASEAKVYDEKDFDGKFEISKLYQTELYPWICGRANAGIPGYELVKTEKFDFTKKLRGETPIILNDDEKKA
jgi:hypothetical protein